MPCAAHAPHPDPCKDRAETAHRGKSLISRSRDAAKSAVEGAAEGVGSVPGPLRRAMRDTLLGDDTLPLVSQRIAEAMVDGMRRGLSEAETQQLIDDVVERTIAGLGRQSGEATRQLIQTIEPELSQALRRSIGSIGVAVGEDIERDLTPRTREMAQALADVLVKALAGGLDVQLEHIRQTARDIGREMITEAALSIRDQKEFVGEITHVAMRQGMLGRPRGSWGAAGGGATRGESPWGGGGVPRAGRLGPRRGAPGPPLGPPRGGTRRAPFSTPPPPPPAPQPVLRRIKTPADNDP